MGDLRKRGRIEISDDLPFTRTSWKVERIGWLTLGALLAAGMLGILGPGLFSSAKAGEAGDPLTVDFERFGHFEADDELTLHLQPRDGTAGVWVEDRYLDGVEIRQIHPRPARVEAKDGRKAYVFSTGDERNPVKVRFDLTYKKVGRLAGRLGTAGAPPVEVRQFIYP